MWNPVLVNETEEVLERYPIPNPLIKQERHLPLPCLITFGHRQKLCTEGLNVGALQSGCWGMSPRVEGKGKNGTKL